MTTKTDIIGFPFINTRGKRNCSFETAEDAIKYFSEIENIGYQRLAEEPQCPFLMITQINAEANFTTTFYYKNENRIER